MEFNKHKRVRIHSDVLRKLKTLHQTEFIWFMVFVNDFANKSGLRFTSKKQTRASRGKLIKQEIYYFKIEDIQKYTLAKLKYGI